MQINWIEVAGLVAIGWIVLRQFGLRIKYLEAEVRRLEVQSNMHEMNIKKLYYFRDIEVYESNTALSVEEQQAFKDELASETDRLAERNKLLLSR